MTPNNALNKASAMQSSGEGRAWKAMNQPIVGDRRTQIVGHDEMGPAGRTLEHDASAGTRPSKNTRSKRNPGAKQFKEPAERGGQDLKSIKKNNYI